MKRVYISSAAQFDNLGDLILRRTAVEWAAEIAADSELHVFVGAAPEQYVRGLGLPACARVHRSLARFYFTFLRKPGAMWWSPGEQTLAYRRKDAVHALLSVASAAYARLRGHAAVKLGRSYSPATGGPLLPVERVLGRLLSMHTVRDVESSKLLTASRVMPDLALASDFLQSRQLGAAPADGRTVADLGFISMRGDRPAAAPDVRAMVRRLAELEVSWRFVVQVEPDEAFNVSLAEHAGGTVDAWHSEHLVQLDVLLAQYRNAQVVVSDRLHVVLFAVSVGAPVVGVDTGSGKMRRHLQVLGLEDRCFTPTEIVALGDDALSALFTSADVIAARGAAEAALHAVKRELQECA